MARFVAALNIAYLLGWTGAPKHRKRRKTVEQIEEKHECQQTTRNPALRHTKLASSDLNLGSFPVPPVGGGEPPKLAKKTRRLGELSDQVSIHRLLRLLAAAASCDCGAERVRTTLCHISAEWDMGSSRAMMQREADVKEHVGNASRVLAVLRVSHLAPRGIGHDPEPAFADDSFMPFIVSSIFRGRMRSVAAAARRASADDAKCHATGLGVP